MFTNQEADMGMRAARKGTIESAGEDVEVQRTMMARWTRDKADAEAELGRVQAAAGEQVLDDPDRAGGLARSMGELRDRIEIAGRAIDAIVPRVAAAEKAWLLAHAAEYEQAVVKAEADLAAHNARTDELLALLRAHEGDYMPLADHIWSLPANERVGMTYRAPASGELQQRAEVARRTVAILRAMADGQDPQVTLNPGETAADAYPACVWGPEALVKAPAYVRTAGQVVDSLAKLEEQLVELPELLEDLRAEETELAANRPPEKGFDRPHAESDPLLKVRRRIGALEEEIARKTAQRDEMRAEALTLTGAERVAVPTTAGA